MPLRYKGCAATKSHRSPLADEWYRRTCTNAAEDDKKEDQWDLSLSAAKLSILLLGLFFVADFLVILTHQPY